MGRPGFDGQLKGLDRGKVEVLARLASEYGSTGDETDDGVVHFYEHYDGSGDDARSYKAVFPTGFQHSPGGPHTSEEVTAIREAETDRNAAKDRDEEIALLEAEREAKLSFVRKCLKEEEALLEESEEGASEPRQSSQFAKTTEESANKPSFQQRAFARSTRVASAEDNVNSATSFGSGLFSRGFLDRASKEKEREANVSSLVEPGATSPDRAPLAQNCMSSTRQSLPRNSQQCGPKKRVSFSERQHVHLYDDSTGLDENKLRDDEASRHSAADAFEAAMLSGSRASEEGGLLEWVEGATNVSDNIMTQERIAYMEHLIAMNDEMEDSDDDPYSDMTFVAGVNDDGHICGSGESAELEHGFVSKVLGPKNTSTEGVCPHSQVLPSPEVANTSLVSEPNTSSNNSIGAIALDHQGLESAEQSASSAFENREEPPSSRGASPSSVKESGIKVCNSGDGTMPSSTSSPLSGLQGDAVDSRVVERVPRRRRASRRRKSEHISAATCTPVLNLDLDHPTHQREPKVLVRIPEDSGQDDIPVDPAPIVSKFMQMRLNGEAR